MNQESHQFTTMKDIQSSLKALLITSGIVGLSVYLIRKISSDNPPSIINAPATENLDCELIYGLVNPANNCFLNSVLQAIASFTKLKSFVSEIRNLPYSENQLLELRLRGIGLPVIKSLSSTIDLLTTLIPHSKSFYPSDIINSLSSKMQLNLYTQQDAQEFLQILVGALNDELLSLKNALSTQSYFLSDYNNGIIDSVKKLVLNNPLQGLLASSLICGDCNYEGPLRLSVFNVLPLSLPQIHYCSLIDVIDQYITPENLDDASCRRCSVDYTIRYLREQLDDLDDPELIEQYRQDIKILSNMSFNIEQDTGDIEVKRKASSTSYKRNYIVNPPVNLCIHINRSEFTIYGAYKNECKVVFDEYLNLTPFTYLSMGDIKDKSIVYKLTAVITHYGSHSSGHFITYRRKPTHVDKNEEPGHNSIVWMAVSDDKVFVVNLEEVLDSNPYMLFYELMLPSEINELFTDIFSEVEIEKTEEFVHIEKDVSQKGSIIKDGNNIDEFPVKNEDKVDEDYDLPYRPDDII